MSRDALATHCVELIDDELRRGEESAIKRAVALIDDGNLDADSARMLWLEIHAGRKLQHRLMARGRKAAAGSA